LVIEDEHHGNRPRAPVGEMLVHQVEMLIAIEQTQGEERRGRAECIDPGLDVHRVRAPVGAEDEEVPAAAERRDAGDELRGDLGATADRPLEVGELGLGRGGEPGLEGEALLEAIEERGHP